jgi:Holliday junction resolvase
MIMKRSFKFYRKNEAEVMESLGLKPTKNSGSGWVEKEDGQNDYIICQLKSTDAQSIKVNQKDIRVLEKNARIEHKLPVFAIQFLNTGEIWLMAKPEDFTSVSEYIETGQTTIQEVLDIEDVQQEKPKRVIKSSENARNIFHDEQKKKWDKTKSAR